MKKGTVDFDIDMSVLDDALSEVAAAAELLGDSGFISRAQKAIRTRLEDWFYDYADAAAVEDPTTWHHVYEWGAIGETKGRNDPGRLFYILTTGTNQYTNKFSYEFKESTEEVPLSDLEDDSRKRRHEFSWKAWVLEAGDPVEISPQPDNTGGKDGTGILAFPAGDVMGYSKSLVIELEENPTTGAFAMNWNEWWDNIAEPMLAARIGASGERSMERVMSAQLRTAGSGRIVETPRPGLRANQKTKQLLESEIMRIIYDA